MDNTKSGADESVGATAVADKSKHEQRALAHEEQIKEQGKKMESLSITSIAEQELANGFETHDTRKGSTFEHDDEPDASDPGVLVNCIQSIISLTQPPPKPPLPWKTYRREEINSYLESKMSGLLGILAPSSKFWYWMGSNKKMKYVGDYDKATKKMRDGRGTCVWPDPSVGGGGVAIAVCILTSVATSETEVVQAESYYGLWRSDQPHDHGIFRWFDGDMYHGDWSEGEMQGYGVYSYSLHGAHPGDRYEGGYFRGQRQGSGVYRYAGKGGGVYLGEWLNGQMDGHGMMMYPDGEFYVGTWRRDKKEGLGVYIWGHSAGAGSGDRYEGHFVDGLSHGLGRTIFSAGGSHRGHYVRGKMRGHGVMETGDGWEYMGGWRDDELNGDMVCTPLYLAARRPVVQRYRMGVLELERAYESGTADWSETEAYAREARGLADEAAAAAAGAMEGIGKFVRRAKESQERARSAAEEAKYYAKAAVRYQAFLQGWIGLKPWILTE